MNLQPQNQQSLIMFAIAIAAIVGGIVGAVSYVTFSNAFGISPLATQTMNTKEVDSKIVELIEEESATIAVVENVTPAVVSVIVKKPRGLITQTVFLGNSFTSPLFFEQDLTSEQKEELVEVGSGTGFFVSEDGYLLTNRHVVNQTDVEYFIVTNEGNEIAAELVDMDPFQDLAILKVEGQAFPCVRFGDSDAIRIGQTVIAIGNTLSEFRNTVTKGVVSGIDRRVTAGDTVSTEVIEKAIQTDAAINPGNSGGPLINLLGEVIGINTAVSYEGESVAFAIPVNHAKRSIDDVRKYGRIIRPWLGVRYVLVMPNEQADISYDYDVGAMIVAGNEADQIAVFKGSPADLAGLKERDIIIAIDSVQLSQDKALAEIISSYRPNDVVTIKVLREGVLFETDVTLAEYTEQ